MLSRLHERERESSAIVGALDEMVAGRGRVVVVEGPAGIGKTSVLELAGDAARARNVARPR
jgi:predicted ATPase